MSGCNNTAPVHLSAATVAQLVEQLIRNQYALLLTLIVVNSIFRKKTDKSSCQIGRRQVAQGVSYAQ